MTKNDPWQGINKPESALSLVARRADPDHPYDFYWAKDIDGRCMLVFEHDAMHKAPSSKPKLKEIEILEGPAQGNVGRFILKLLEDDNREIFGQLCRDVIEATRQAGNQAVALAIILRRTWRWQRMLKSVTDARLSAQQQKGLIGELLFLRDCLLNRFEANEALSFWLGPEGSPKDFAINALSIEVKTKRGAAKPYVEISSEFQLDTSDVQSLFLAVATVDESSESTDGSFELGQLVDEIGREIEHSNAGAACIYEERLATVGYRYEHDYGDQYWKMEGFQFYEVTDSFPRVTGAVPAGVSKVRYRVNLGECSGFKVSVDVVEKMLTGNS